MQLFEFVAHVWILLIPPNVTTSCTWQTTQVEYHHQSCHVGWGPRCSQLYQVSLAWGVVDHCVGGSKSAISLYLALWLIQQIWTAAQTVIWLLDKHEFVGDCLVLVDCKRVVILIIYNFFITTRSELHNNVSDTGHLKQVQLDLCCFNIYKLFSSASGMNNWTCKLQYWTTTRLTVVDVLGLTELILAVFVCFIELGVL